MLKSVPRPSIEIPDHVVVEKIGSGGMSSVFLGKQISLQRKVAIKVLRQSLVEDLTLAERFVDEAKTIALLDHPNIISIYEAKRLPSGMSYFTMPYLNHGHFGDIICTNAKHLIDLLCQICDGLACAHEHGVVHRDLKPDNILFDRFGHLKIADFGIALSRNKKRQTKDQQVLGSAHYMSPEQIQSKAVNHLSDIYSLGCIIYEKLTGDNVFNAENDFAILLAHINKPVPELPKSLANWQTILNKCLAKKPEDRYQSALEVKRDLLEIRNQDNETHTGKLLFKWPKWLQKSHAAIVAGLLLLTALFAILVSGEKAPKDLGSQASPDKQMEAEKTPDQQPPTQKQEAVEELVTIQPEAAKTIEKPLPESDERRSTAQTAEDSDIELPDTSIQPIQDLNVEIVAVTPVEANDEPLVPSIDIDSENLNTDVQPVITEPVEGLKTATVEELFSKEEQVTALLKHGQELLKKYRLTRPKDENALAKFKRVLVIDPGNIEAKKGIEQIARSYFTLIQSKWKKNEGKSTVSYAKTMVNFIKQNKINSQLFQKPFDDLEKDVTKKIKQAIKVRRRFKNLDWQMKVINVLKGKPKAFLELQRQYRSIPHSGKLINDPSGATFVFFAVNSNTVGLGDFMIAQNEVTVAEYQQFAAGQKPAEKCSHLGSKPIFKRFTWQKTPFKQNSKHPVVCVSATSANAYAKWLSKKTGYRYRLPTKQEWLYLNQISNHKDDCKYANLAGTEIKGQRKLSKQVLSCKDDYKYTAEVGSFASNKHKLNDLNGNVAEWVSLCKKPNQCSQFGMAGNSWQTGKKPNNKSITELKSSESQSNLGFRLVRIL